MVCGAMGIIIINSFYTTFIFILFFTLNISFSYVANDTITTIQSLSGDQTLVSTGGKFELGFFKPGNSLNYYVGMWYKKDSLQTILWVANRDTPVSDKFSSQLKIIDGNLVILDGSRTQIWSTNMNPSSSNPILAVLRDDGNLVLIDGLTSNGSNSNVLNAMPIWESFNHPTDTLFPGAKIAYNKLTKRKQMLTSWKNFEDPGMGLFSYEIDPKGSQLMIKFNGSKSYWSTGAWNGEFFSSVPEMTKDNVYNFSYIAYIDKENETYFTYSFFDTSIQARLVMDTSGQIEVLLWLGHIPEWSLFWSQPQQRRHCQSDAYCGAFSVCNQNSSPYCNCLTGFTPTPSFANNYSADCVRRVDLECGNADLARGKKNRFLMSSHMGLPDFPQSVAVASVEECEANCLNNCSCTAYAYYDNGCSIWNGVLVNLKQLSVDDGNGKVIYVRVSSSEFSSAKSGVDIGIVVGCIVGVLALLGLPFVVMRRRTCRTWLAGPPKALEGSLVAFGYKDLKSATKNFSEKLGGGGFGSVFKGTLYNSTVVAVKRLEGISQGEKQFRAEVNTVGTIQHVNLVRLCGFCSEGKKNLLVYEYMPNGSLNSHLFHVKDSKVLDWKKRYQIALGTARGLAYLHENCRDCIIHCDIKPENILLDAEFCPKVADFGLAKLFGHEFSRVLTTMRGTRGYLAPEWISGVAITSKADVYSYGMMLFELVSGRRNTELQLNREVIFFPTEAASVTTREGDLISLLDHRLENIADAEEVTRICRVACWCIQDEENLRPSMGQVVQILEGVLDIKLPQMPHSLQVFADNREEHMLFFTELSSGLSSHAQLHPLNPH